MMIQVRKKGDEAWYNPDRDVVNLLPKIISDVFATAIGLADDPKLKEFLDKTTLADPKSEDHIAFAIRLGAFITKGHTVASFDELCKAAKLDELPADKMLKFLSAIGWRILQAYHDGITDLRPEHAQTASRAPEINQLIKQMEESVKPTS
jgi:hypothetical protein